MGAITPVSRISERIRTIRGQRVILSHELAALYGVPTKILTQAVRRNLKRFPDDFLFQLTKQEVTNLRSRTVISSSDAWGGSRYAPLAFTEQGVAMLSSVLKSPRAVAVNIEIMRTFVRLRQWVLGNKDLALKLSQLESKVDGQARTVNSRLKLVFEALEELMTPPPRPKRPIGFKR